MFKLKFLLLLAASLFLLTSCTPHSQADSETNPAQPIPTGELVKQSDALFAQRTDVEKLRQAVNIITQARNPDQRNFEVEWKFAKYSYFLSKQTANEKDTEKLLKDGYAAGMIAARLDPQKPDGYFWAGACLGEQSRRSPLTVGISSTDEIRGLMNKTIEIQPDYEGASAFDVLAQVELSTRLLGGSVEKALEYLEKALAFEKENSYIYLHLAEAYLAIDKKEEAKKQIDHILKMKADPEYAVEYQEVLEKAKKMLETKF